MTKDGGRGSHCDRTGRGGAGRGGAGAGDGGVSTVIARPFRPALYSSGPTGYRPVPVDRGPAGTAAVQYTYQWWAPHGLGPAPAGTEVARYRPGPPPSSTRTNGGRHTDWAPPRLVQRTHDTGRDRRRPVHVPMVGATRTGPRSGWYRGRTIQAADRRRSGRYSLPAGTN